MPTGILVALTDRSIDLGSEMTIESIANRITKNSVSLVMIVMVVCDKSCKVSVLEHLYQAKHEQHKHKLFQVSVD